MFEEGTKNKYSNKSNSRIQWAVSMQSIKKIWYITNKNCHSIQGNINDLVERTCNSSKFHAHTNDSAWTNVWIVVAEKVSEKKETNTCKYNTKDQKCKIAIESSINYLNSKHFGRNFAFATKIMIFKIQTKKGWLNCNKNRKEIFLFMLDFIATWKLLWIKKI